MPLHGITIPHLQVNVGDQIGKTLPLGLTLRGHQSPKVRIVDLYLPPPAGTPPATKAVQTDLFPTDGSDGDGSALPDFKKATWSNSGVHRVFVMVWETQAGGAPALGQMSVQSIWVSVSQFSDNTRGVDAALGRMQAGATGADIASAATRRYLPLRTGAPRS